MKNLITLVTLIFVTTALCAQNDMPAGINDVFNQNKPGHQKEFIKKYDKIPGEVNSEFLYVKNINGTIWVKDSTLYYNGNYSTEWNLESREKVLSRDDFGNMTTAISHAWDNTNETWMQPLDTISATYFNTDFIHEYFKKGWNNQTNDWADTSEYRLYNEYGYVLKYIRRSWDYASNSFPWWGFKFSTTYDENGKTTKEHGHDWDAETQEWVDPYLRDSYVYNHNGNCIQSVEYSWDTITEEWVNSKFRLFVYDDDGYQIQSITQIWYSNTEEWINSYKYIFGHDNNGNETQFTKQTWDNNVEEWVNNYQYLWTFDDNDNETQRLYQIWDAGIGEWVNSQQRIITYDDNNNPTYVIFKYWDNEIEEWINNRQNFNTYDDNGNFTHQLRQIWDNDTEEWINSVQQIMPYDDKGNWTQYISLIWNIETEEWDNDWRNDYYWSQYEITGVDNEKNNCKIAVYPNPSNGLVTITSNINANNKIEILNVSGQMVYSVSITSGQQQIDLRYLSIGIYFIKVIGNKYSKTVKLIIK